MKVLDVRRGALFIAMTAVFVLPTGFASAQQKCMPTAPDMIGPFYKPGAPVRDSVGKGYVLSGTVRSSYDCSPIEQAQIEFWLAGPDGYYDDHHRATVFSGKKGTYRFESDAPPPYAGRPPHIHIRVSAPGFRILITQHYPVAGTSVATMDLVLIPAQ